MAWTWQEPERLARHARTAKERAYWRRLVEITPASVRERIDYARTERVRRARYMGRRDGGMSPQIDDTAIRTEHHLMAGKKKPKPRPRPKPSGGY